MQTTSVDKSTKTSDAKPDVIAYNPATLEEIGRVKNSTPEDVHAALRKAKVAFPAWSALSYGERAEYMWRVRRYLLDHINEIATVISKDNGKPLVESVSSEIYPVCELIGYWAENTAKALKPKKIGLGVWNWLLRFSEIRFRPKGVIGIVSPWNYPFSIPMGQIVMSLMAGNCVILKQSSSTPLVGDAMEKVFKGAGLPDGVFIHVPGDSSVGSALMTCGVDKIVFTGSVPIGKKVMEMAAKNLTPITLELGGKDPMVVCKDADLEIAAAGAVWGAFANAGQICASVERVYVHESVAEKFIKLVVEKTNKLRLGEGTRFDVDMGAMTTESQMNEVSEQVEDAKKRGAKILTGGERVAGNKGYFYKPTVLTGVDHTFRCVMEETFGPTMPIMTFKDEDEAVRLANDSEYGLTASVWTRDIERGRQLAGRIKAGTVTVNDNVYTFALSQTPWGGHGLSGFGRTHSIYGMLELVDVHHIHVNRSGSFSKSFWWFGYSETTYKLICRMADTLTAPGIWSKVKAIPDMIRMALLPKY
ncbi:MAG: aldehyde dehydrogenase family protein [Elusimicrobiota bacterium]